MSMWPWAWAWGRRQTCRGLMTEMPSTALEIPSVVWSMALCTATLHHHLRYERRGWVQPDVQPCPLRTTRNSSTAVRTCTACGGFDAAKDSDRSTAIQAKLYIVPVPYLQSSDGPGRLALSRVCDNCCEIYARPPVVWKGALSTMTRRLLAPNSPSSHQPVPSLPPAVSSPQISIQLRKRRALLLVPFRSRAKATRQVALPSRMAAARK
jgi:hypothetical protein